LCRRELGELCRKALREFTFLWWMVWRN